MHHVWQTEQISVIIYVHFKVSSSLAPTSLHFRAKSLIQKRSGTTSVVFVAKNVLDVGDGWLGESTLNKVNKREIGMFRCFWQIWEGGGHPGIDNCWIWHLNIGGDTLGLGPSYRRLQKSGGLPAVKSQVIGKKTSAEIFTSFCTLILFQVSGVSVKRVKVSSQLVREWSETQLLED